MNQEIRPIFENNWEGEGDWSNFINGMLGGPGHDRDSTIKKMKTLGDLSGGDQLTLLALTAQLLEQIDAVCKKKGDSWASDAVDNFFQLVGPSGSFENEDQYKVGLAQWRNQITEKFINKYTGKTDVSRVSRGVLAAAFGFVSALNDDKPQALPPLTSLNGGKIYSDAQKYIGFDTARNG